MAAAERIRQLAEGPALVELERIITSGDSDGVRLAAARDVLDRAGYKATEKVDVTSKGEAFSFTIQSRRTDGN